MTEEIITIKTTTPPEIGERHRYIMTKDATNYDIIAIKLPKGIECGYMCNTTQPQILIISGYNRTAYNFPLKGYLSWEYIHEKLCPKDNRRDAENLKILIEKAKEELQ